MCTGDPDAWVSATLACRKAMLTFVLLRRIQPPLLFSEKRGLLTFVHNNLLGSAQLGVLCHGEFLNPGKFKKLFITEFHPLKASLLLVQRVV